VRCVICAHPAVHQVSDISAHAYVPPLPLLLLRSLCCCIVTAGRCFSVGSVARHRRSHAADRLNITINHAVSLNRICSNISVGCRRRPASPNNRPAVPAWHPSRPALSFQVLNHDQNSKLYERKCSGTVFCALSSLRGPEVHSGTGDLHTFQRVLRKNGTCAQERSLGSDTLVIACGVHDAFFFTVFWRKSKNLCVLLW
jgi:hypothetical protein